MAVAVSMAAGLWGGIATAAPEQIVCQQDPRQPSMADCVLISPASQSSAVGAGATSPNAVTYHVVEPIRRDARNVVVAPEQSVVVAEQAVELRQPSVPQPYPMESSARSERPEVRYLVAERALPAAAPGETVVVPAQRIFITEPAPFPSVTAPPWPD
jgi:hypothetical protein